MTETMPRQNRRRADARPILPEDIQTVVTALREQGDRRHDETQERLNRIEGQVGDLNRTFTDHARADREGMDKIAEAIKANTAITMQTHNDTRDIVETWRGVNTLRRAVVWVATFVAAVATIVAVGFYFAGKGPFPGAM